MAHGERAEKNGHSGTDYWKSRLHRWGEIPGRFTKHLTHKKERREKKKIEREAKINIEGT